MLIFQTFEKPFIAWLKKEYCCTVKAKRTANIFWQKKIENEYISKIENTYYFDT